MKTWKRRLEDLRMSEAMPVDVLPASNGEFFPGEPTPEQRRIMALQEEQGEEARRRLGLSRRDFVRTGTAIGVGLWAINTVMPGQWGRYRAFAAPPGSGACELEFADAQLDNLPGEFIFDVQSHHVDSGGDWRVTNPGFHVVFSALWEQSGPLGGRPGIRGDGSIRGWGEGQELDPIENLSRFHYLKELYLDSSTTMTVLSAVPSENSRNPLPVDEAAATVEMVNRMAGGTRRASMHAFVMPNRGSYGTTNAGAMPVFLNQELEDMERHITLHGDHIVGWKVYTPWGDVPYASGWYLDDAVGQAFLDQVRHLGDKHGANKVIACHKGFALPSFDQRAASPRDVGPAARANPDVNIIVYHSGYDSETQTAYPGDDNVNSADRGVNCFVKSLRENAWDATRFVPAGLQHGNVPNVYAEIGATMRSVMNSPDQLAHLLGKLITWVGPRRVVWGTDSLWFGSPQTVIAALRSFDMSPQARELYNLPHGLDGDRFDPRLNALQASSYPSTGHPHVSDWPTDGRAHPERTIRNGIFGRNAAEPYKVDPDAARAAISCDEVQKLRDSYLINPATPREVNAGASNTMPAPRTRRELLKMVTSSPWAP